METDFFQICLGHGKTGNHHGQRGIHIRNIFHGVDQRRGDAELQEKEDRPDDRAHYDGGKKPFF